MDLRDIFKQINPNGEKTIPQDNSEDEYANTASTYSLNNRSATNVAEISNSGLPPLNLSAPMEVAPSNLPQGNLPPVNDLSFSSLNLGKKDLNTNLLGGNHHQQMDPGIDVTQVIPTKDQDFFAPPSSMKDVGLSPISIQDLLLKCLFYQSNASGKELANKIRLPLHSIVDPMLMKLSEEKFVEVTGTTGLGGFNKIYRLTTMGYNRAEDVLKVSNYVGPAPVSLTDYTKAVTELYGILDFSEEALRDSYKDLVLSESAFDQVGPALLSGKSMFLYGPAGTGKTSIAERITRCYKSTIKVPYAVNVQGIPMRFFDYFLHIPSEPNLAPGSMPPLRQDMDNRWIEIRRPCIVVGPEFTIASADLQYDPDGPSYQFPSSIKSNGGVFVVDDFGRQRENPEVLLNRWIIPLDKQKDILNLRTGQQISVPFRVFTVFSTNLDPKQLVDDAFLRRLAYKIKVDYPTLETYCQIFANEADKANMKWEDELLDYFIQTHYIKAQRPMRACDPKDILSRATDICRYTKMKTPFKLSRELIDRACRSYFVGG
ncbi:MAG: hypothetical protein SFU25_04845 [Candidatus Caenarcaniphilales bacterium]|nr:hypothetical protein [Candidatus Caenarcaniphilales bacterium]